MKFIEIKDVKNNNCIISADKIICIREKQYVKHFNDGYCSGSEGVSAVYIICTDDVEIITYESIESIIDKIKK